MDTGAWRGTVHGIAKRQTHLSLLLRVSLWCESGGQIGAEKGLRAVVYNSFLCPGPHLLTQALSLTPAILQLPGPWMSS